MAGIKSSLKFNFLNLKYNTEDINICRVTRFNNENIPSCASNNPMNEVNITLTKICNIRKESNFNDLLGKTIEFIKNPGI